MWKGNSNEKDNSNTIMCGNVRVYCGLQQRTRIGKQ